MWSSYPLESENILMEGIRYLLSRSHGHYSQNELVYQPFEEAAVVSMISDVAKSMLSKLVAGYRRDRYARHSSQSLLR